MQHDLSERSALHVNISNQLTQENKGRMTKIAELEQALSQEQKNVRNLLKLLIDMFILNIN